MAVTRRRKQPEDEVQQHPDTKPDEDDDKEEKALKKSKSKNYSCLDNCCWFVGCVCTAWWLLLFLYNAMPASFPQFVTEAITGPMPDPPGVKCLKEGLKVKHPVVFVPGIVTGGLELWEGHQCMDGLFRKRLWGGTFGEVYKRPSCWVQHMSLDNKTGMDPPGIRVRPVSGLVAADYFAPGYFVWAVLIANLARVGYEEKNMYMAAYDWRLSFQNTEVRDQSLSRIKSNIELMVATNGGNKAVVIPHSMGVIYFLHFMKWVEAPAPMGGGGGPDWCAKHIKAVMNIGGPFLGVPKAVAGLFSAEAKDIASARALAPGVLDSDLFQIQTLQHLMRMSRTWDSTMSMIPKGGDTIWGGLDWSPEEGYCPSKRKNGKNVTENESTSQECEATHANYGRMVSFGRDVAEAQSSEIERIEFRGAVKGNSVANHTCRDVWTEYHDMGFGGIKAVAEYKVYTAGEIVDMLEFVAPKMQNQNNHPDSSSPFTTPQPPNTATETPKRRYRTAASAPFFPFDSDRCRHEIARMIIMHDYPLHIVEHPGFVSFVHNLQPRFDLVNFSTVQGDCVATYLSEKDKIQKVIESMPGRVCLTVDLYGSCQTTGYVYVTGQFVDSEWKIHRKLLNVVMEPYPDSDSAFSHAVSACLSDWNMEGRLFSITINQPVSEIGIESLRNLLSEKNPNILGGQLLLGNCLSRSISGIVAESLATNHETVKKVRDCVKYVKTSESLEEKFLSLKQQLQVPSTKTLAIDNQTQWNTTYEMLQSASELKEVFSCLDTTDSDYSKGPTREEWNVIENLCAYLKILYDTANLLTTSSVPTTNTFFHEAWKIQLELARAAASESNLSSFVHPERIKC